MDNQEDYNIDTLYNMLAICKRFPINQVVKIILHIDEVYSNMSIAVVKGYCILDKDVDNLKSGEFVLEVETISLEKEPFKKYLINPKNCTPVSEEFYLSYLSENSYKTDYIKQRLFISDEVHKENIEIVKQFKIGSLVEVELSLTNHESEEEIKKNLLGKIVGYNHDLENEQKQGLFKLQVELFPMRDDKLSFALNQIIHISTDCCKVI